MPWKLRKAPKKELYWVVNKETGKKHSKEPLPRDKAVAQMKALYANEPMVGGVRYINPKEKSATIARLKAIPDITHAVPALTAEETAVWWTLHPEAADNRNSKSIARSARTAKEFYDSVWPPPAPQPAPPVEKPPPKVYPPRPAPLPREPYVIPPPPPEYVKDYRAVINPRVRAKTPVADLRERQFRTLHSPFGRERIGQEGTVASAWFGDGELTRFSLDNDFKKELTDANAPQFYLQSVMGIIDGRSRALKGQEGEIDTIYNYEGFQKFKRDHPIGSGRRGGMFRRKKRDASYDELFDVLSNIGGGVSGKELFRRSYDLIMKYMENIGSINDLLRALKEPWADYQKEVIKREPKFTYAKMPITFFDIIRQMYEAKGVAPAAAPAAPVPDDQREKAAAVVARSMSRAVAKARALREVKARIAEREAAKEAREIQEAIEAAEALVPANPQFNMIAENIPSAQELARGERREARRAAERERLRIATEYGRFNADRVMKGKGKNVTISKPEFIREHENLLRILKKGDKSELRAEAADQSAELAKVVGGAISKDLLQQMAQSAYSGKTKLQVGPYKLVFSTPTLKFYKDGDTIVVSIRGTDNAEDLKADAMAIVNQLKSSSRYKRDLDTLRNFQKKYPKTRFRYIGVAHSLGAAIMDGFIRAGLIRNGMSYNGLAEPSELGGNPLHHRIYHNKDPLYMAFGRHMPNIEVRTTQDSFLKTLATKILPFGLGTIFKLYDNHILGTFKGGN